ncbi:unnamed protein product [Microthlaspi erraticum]|uniref:U-box domain-containing protein n=1 Tax=Microthlaspi erraticum TaxID=1685480 RepID=A0A6D2I6S5_9BRAS|nr:unnamed protein product [Microthlaspi erraticum]
MAATNDTVDISQQTIHNINMSNIIKLNSTNYLMWSLQVHSLLEGYDLAGHLDGSTAVTSVNPAYTKWKRQDRLIYSGLLGTISLTIIQPILSTSRTSFEIWSTLASTYAKPSRVHIKQVKHQLKICSKGTKSIDEYKLVVDQIEGRDTPPSLTEVHENPVSSLPTLLRIEAPITTNLANTCPRQFQNKHTARLNQSWNSNPTHHPHTEMSQDNRMTRGGYQVKCQLCGVQGHSAKTCPQLPNQERERIQDVKLQLEYTRWKAEKLESKYNVELSLRKQSEAALDEKRIELEVTKQELETVKGLLESSNEETNAMREERDLALEVMTDPHLTADGHTYEGEDIKKWFSTGHDTSPLTNLKLPHFNLVPNRSLRSAIQDLNL